jgi:hypothetical protein
MAQQPGMENVFFTAAFCGIPLFILAVYLALQLITIITLTRALSVLPERDLRITPAQAWLLLIPCFNLVWNFIVWLRAADSFQSYFQRMGRTDLGDFGRGIYLAHCILAVLTVAPYAGCVAVVADLVLWIMSLARISYLRGEVVRTEFPSEPAP